MGSREDFNREYMNSVPPIEADAGYCKRCKCNTRLVRDTDYEITREPNKSHPEWFHVSQTGSMIRVTPKLGHLEDAVLSVFWRCAECRYLVRIT